MIILKIVIWLIVWVIGGLIIQHFFDVRMSGLGAWIYPIFYGVMGAICYAIQH